MTEYENALEAHRIETKLRLWITPGFFQFIEDLKAYMPESCVGLNIDVLKRLYEAELEKLSPKSNYIQTELAL